MSNKKLLRYLSSAHSKIEAQINRETRGVDAIFDDDLWEFLESNDLLEPLDRGELRCSITGDLLSRDNLGGFFIGEGGKIFLISDSAEPASVTQRPLKL